MCIPLRVIDTILTKEPEKQNNLDALLEAFPFKAPKRHPDEPRRKTAHFLGTLQWTDEDLRVADEWFDWAGGQPDFLLFTEHNQQCIEWLYEKGNISPEKLEEWANARKVVAEKIRSRGYGDVIDKYWSESLDLPLSR